MKKTAILLSMILAAVVMSVLSRDRNYSQAVQAAGTNRITVLIRFGVDGAPNVDWSGSISPAPSRLAGWQLDTGEEAKVSSWRCSTRQQTYWDTPYEAAMGPTANRVKVTPKGIVAEFTSPPASEVRVTTGQGSFSFELNSSLWASPRKFLDGRAEARAAPSAAALSSGPEAGDYPSLIKAKDGTLWLAYVGWTSDGDQVFTRRRTGDGWSEPQAVARARGDFFRTALAEDRAGRIWVVWAAQVSGNFDLYASSYDGRSWSSPAQLTTAPGSDIFHSLISDRSGKIYLAYQSSRSGNFDIYLQSHDGKSWSKEIQISSDPANDWEPKLAAAPDGRVTIVWDTYAKGSYDVVARTLQAGKLGPIIPIAESGAFEARSSIQYDRQGRLWMAWEHGDWNWGKDYGNLIGDRGRGLMVRRETRVGVLAGGGLEQTSASLSDAVPEEFRQAFQSPLLVLDERDVPWVFFRYRVNLPRETKGETYRGSWRLAATSYQNGRWLPMIEFPEGYGRQDAPMSAAAAPDGGVQVVWVSDGRLWPAAFPSGQHLLGASFPAAGAASEPQLVGYSPPAESFQATHPNEASDLARVRAYRTQAGARKLRIVRGDIHRHTDLSWDGNRDGSLNDSYRYAMDAAGLDYLGVCDHQAGQSIPYHWWMIQKAVDLFTIPGKFAPLYSYERSLPWPNGHRNVVFAERGRPVLEIPQAEQRGEEGAGRLYQYLRKFGGLVSSHTSATGAGTDWRDSDPDLEPVVEIYQGYRNNYEEPAGPRHPEAPEAKRFGAGFVWNAWAKNIKMGVQSSSDHVSTHISYAATLVDQVERHSIFQALKARRSYAATDNLIIDVRMGEHFMGESFRAAGTMPIQAYIRGTAPLARVSLIRNNRNLLTRAGDSEEMTFSYVDTETPSGESWYYIRVEQTNGEIGWSSPVWVTR